MPKNDVFSFEDDFKPVGEEKSEMAKVSQLLLNNAFRRRKTIIPERLVAPLTTLDSIAWIYDIEFLKEWVRNYGEYLTSKEGQGRKDIVGIAQAGLEKEKQRWDDFMGIMGKR